MITAVLAKQYHFTTHTIGMNLDGMTEAQALVCPPEGGSSANWVLGHILAARNGVHSLLEIGPALAEAQAAPYQRGAPSVSAEHPGLPLSELLAVLKRSHDEIASAIAVLDTERLETKVQMPAPLGECTVAEGLGLLQFHEAYHAGQLAVLRRLTGMPGAIR